MTYIVGLVSGMAEAHIKLGFLLSKETVLLRAVGGRVKLNFVFIKRVDKG